MSPVQENKNSTDAARPRRGGAADWIAATLLFIGAAVIAGAYLSSFVNAGGRPFFYQDQFGPAVMLACGDGYVNPRSAAVPALDAFLRVQSDRVACAAENRQAGTAALTSRQRAFRYLIMTVGWTWRVEGNVSWSGLAPLYCLLYGTTIVLAFVIFRQGMGTSLSSAFAAALAVSTLHLNNLPDLRDYAKAPFVLALVLLAMKLAVTSVSRRRILTLAAAAGVVTGIGVGFRSDLLVAAPAFVALLALFLPIPVRERVGLRLAAIGLYVAMFLLALSPMATIYRTGGGNSSQHLVLLGLANPFTDALGLENDGLYEWSDDYRDEKTHAMVSAYADRRLGQHEYLEIYGPEYDRAAGRYLADVAVNFPADMLARVYASGLQLVRLPYSATALQAPRLIDGEWTRRAYAQRRTVLRALAAVWPIAIIVTLASLSVWRLRLGVFAAGCLLYLSGYPALQFHERHFFQLEFLAWWALGFALTQGGGAVVALLDAPHRAAFSKRIRPDGGWISGLAWAGMFWLGVTAATIGPLVALRWYQQRHVRGILQSEYVDVPRQALPMTRTPLEHGLVRFDGPGLSPAVQQALATDAVHGDYIVSGFGGPRCDALAIPVTFRYAATEPQFDFSRTIRVAVPPAAGVTDVFYPAYFHRQQSGAEIRSGYRLAGVELPASSADCLTRLSRLEASAPFPIMLGLVLPPGWQEATLYQTVAALERRRPVAGTPTLYASPDDLSQRRSVLTGALDPFSPADVVLQSPAFHMTDREWRVRPGGGTFSYIVEMKPRAAAKGRYVIAEGRLKTGGLTVGLVNGSTWAAQVTITRPGDFIAMIQAPADGRYAFVLANNLEGSRFGNDVVITRAGWLADAVH